MFEKGDYVQSVNYGYIVLVDKVSGDSFSGIVVEGGDKFHKTGSTHDAWGVEYFKKINYSKHEESENDYHAIDNHCSIFIPRRGGKNTFEKHLEKMRAINPKAFLREYSLLFDTEIKEEREMGNKIKIDDKVVLRTDIAFQLPYTIVKGTILNVDLIQFDRARVSTPVVSFVVPLEFLIKVEDEKETKEEVRVVRKLEDLIGLTNGHGLEITKGHTEYMVCVGDLWTLLTYDCKIDLVMKHLKLMGFKFEYKPLRTKEEVLADIKRLACERSQDCRTMIFQDVNTKKYFATDDYRTLENDKKYFNEDIAHDLVNEINEILERDK